MYHAILQAIVFKEHSHMTAVGSGTSLRNSSTVDTVKLRCQRRKSAAVGIAVAVRIGDPAASYYHTLLPNRQIFAVDIAVVVEVARNMRLGRAAESAIGPSDT